MIGIVENFFSCCVAGDIPKRFSLTADELDSVEGSESDEQQRQLLEQIVIDKDLPVAMRTIQVRNNIMQELYLTLKLQRVL